MSIIVPNFGTFAESYLDRRQSSTGRIAISQ
jgi:hypothetical protein